MSYYGEDSENGTLKANGTGGFPRTDRQPLLVTHALTSEGHDASEDGTGRGTPLVAAPLSHGSNPNSNMAGRRREDDENLVIAGPLGGGNDGTDRRTKDDPNLVTALDTYNQTTGDVSQSLRDPNGTFGDALPAVSVGASVRRLMPVECERLQALPDGHTCSCGGSDAYRTLLRMVRDAALAQGLSEREARGLVVLCEEEVLRHALLLSAQKGSRPSDDSCWTEASAACFRILVVSGLRCDERAYRQASHRPRSDKQLKGERDVALRLMSFAEALARGFARRPGGSSADRQTRSYYWPDRLSGLEAFCSCPGSRRYAALGDAVTATVAEWIGRRMLETDREAV